MTDENLQADRQHLSNSENVCNVTDYLFLWHECYRHWANGAVCSLVWPHATFESKSDSIVSMYIALQSYNGIDGIVTYFFSESDTCVPLLLHSRKHVLEMGNTCRGRKKSGKVKIFMG